MKRWRIVEIEDTELETSDWGSGEPIVFVQTALTADELLPLAEAPALQHGYRKVVYHRRGYAGSSPSGLGSITRDAADCLALMKALRIERAHIVGYSYSGAVGLQVAADHAQFVHSLTLLEPPPVHTPSAPEFRAANARLLQSRREQGAATALDEFLSAVVGPEWRQVMENHLPDSVTQVERDTATFFDVDLPALLDWQFGTADARRIRSPVLHIGGNASGRWFAEVRDLILGWLPQAEDVVIAGADHSLVLTHTSDVADAVAAFLRKHSISAVGPKEGV